MLSPEQQKLQSEVVKAEEVERVYDSYIRPFIEEKRVVLFEVFQSTSVRDMDALRDVKLQLTAINALEAHFKEFMNTGKLAKKQLES